MSEQHHVSIGDNADVTEPLAEGKTVVSHGGGGGGGSTAASTVPENKKAPCNICGRGWPYHHDACAYKHTAIERDRYREALDEIVAWFGSGIAAPPENPIHDIVARARKALDG